MRIFICLLVLLCGCSRQNVRCDSHLLSINPPAPKSATVVPDARSMP